MNADSNNLDRSSGGGKPTVSVVCGSSMKPFFRAGQRVAVQKVVPETIRTGNVILFASGDGDGPRFMHRVVKVVCENGGRWFLCRGDNRSRPDGLVPESRVLGRVVGRYHKGRLKPIPRYQEYGGLILAGTCRRARQAAKKVLPALWPLAAPLFVRRMAVLDNEGREKELFLLGWGKMRFRKDFSRFAVKTGVRR